MVVMYRPGTHTSQLTRAMPGALGEALRGASGTDCQARERKQHGGSAGNAERRLLGAVLAALCLAAL